MRDADLQFLNPVTGTIAEQQGGGHLLAIRSRRGSAPGVVWFGGFRSDMQSTKAVALDRWCDETGHACLRLDYSGHGESAGVFEEGTIGRWSADALAAFLNATNGPQIVVGSSMGGWIALLVARELARRGQAGRLAGLVLIAPAIDFTEALMWRAFPPAIRDAIVAKGQWMRPSTYGEDAYPITRALIEDGREHLLLDTEIRTHCPVHILQGMKDDAVPWSHAMLLVEHLTADPVSITLVKDGDHRLSRDEDVVRLIAAVSQLTDHWRAASAHRSNVGEQDDGETDIAR